MNEMTGEKFMNDYRLQYWLYAIINKRFGRQAKMVRDNLHRAYSVNRHGFDVKGVSALTLMKEVSQILLDAGYKKDEECPKFASDLVFVKVVTFKNKEQKQYVTLMHQRENPSRFGARLPDYCEVIGRVYDHAQR